MKDAGGIMKKTAIVYFMMCMAASVACGIVYTRTIDRQGICNSISGFSRLLD